jgi:hypothetical protein
MLMDDDLVEEPDEPEADEPLQPPERDEPALDDPLDEASAPLEPPPLCGLPRRFGIRGMLIMMTLAAFLMGLLRGCGASGSVYFMVITFVTGTLVGQVLLFQGRSPMKAAMWTGGVLLPGLSLALLLFWNAAAQTTQSAQGAFVMGCLCMCAGLAPVGAILGAVSGTVAGGLYLIAEEVFLALTRGVPKIALAPIEDADAYVLLRWITGPKFCRRWAGDELTWPLDRGQLLARFATARGEQPLRLIFKAVDRRTDNMVGYVELGNIDLSARSATLELAMVDPGEFERGRISVRLFQAIARRAFGKLKLLSITVADDASQEDLVLCCNEAWQSSYEYRPPSPDGEPIWTVTRRGAGGRA